MHGQVRPLGKVLSQQSIGILVGAALPRALRIAEVHIDIGCECKALVVGKFLAPVPGQGFIELPR